MDAWLTVPPEFATSTLAYAGQLFTDLYLLIFLALGIPVGFWGIRQIVGLVKGKMRG